MTDALPHAPLSAKVTFTKTITLVGDIDYIRDPDGKITHISIQTENRDEPSLIPFEGTHIEPFFFKRLRGSTCGGEYGV